MAESVQDRFARVVAEQIASGEKGTVESVAEAQMEIWGRVAPQFVEKYQPEFEELIEKAELEVVEAGIPITPAIAAVGAILGVLGVSAGAVGTLETMAVAGYGLYEAFDGEGGLDQDMGNGVDLYGATGMVTNGGMVPVSGPGVPEPPRAMVAKQWKTKAFSKTVGEYWVYFFRLIDGRIMCYNAAKRSWKMWRPKKPLAVLYRGKTTLSQAIKVQSYLDKLWRQVARKTKALKMA